MSPGEKSLGHYRIERELGRGGTGTVYLARDTRLHRRVALKVFPTRLRNSAWLQTKIEREAELSMRVQAPGICPVYETGIDGEHAFIAMRYVRGESLAAWLARRERGASSAELDGVLARVESLARTIHIAHEAGIVHYDLKPSNVMLPPGGEPVVLDFGTARDAGEQTGRARFRGTPEYAAPEQVQPELGLADRRADVFSLGVMLYECVTGARPFRGSNPESLFRSLLSLAPRSPRSLNRAVSRDLESVLLAALRKRPDARYQTALDLSEDLRRVRAREPIAVRPPSLGKRYARWTCRRPAVAAGVTAAALLLGLGSVLSTWLWQEERVAIAGVRQLSDHHAVPVLLRREAEENWPARAAGLAAMNPWLAEAQGILARRGTGTGDLPSLAETVARVRERRDDAQTLALRTIDAHLEEWERTIAAIADVEANPQYRGLVIEPQEGLVPLGQDPHSGLFEFGHPQTGNVPGRNPETGELYLTDSSGFVFVLLPGGTFRMGAERPTAGMPEGSPNVDPHARDDEGPVHEVTLDPFFLSKLEASQWLWIRLGGKTLSRDWTPKMANNWPTDGSIPARWLAPRERDCSPFYRRGGAFASGPHPWTRTGGGSWGEVMGYLARLGLTLPTEAQHEYATRGGTTSVWWTGDESDRLQATEAVGPVAVSAVYVGKPNPFGLLHMHGNGGELLLDVYGAYSLPVRPGDGLRLVPTETAHLIRGHSRDPLFCRSAARSIGDWRGFRPARALDSEWKDRQRSGVEANGRVATPAAGRATSAVRR